MTTQELLDIATAKAHAAPTEVAFHGQSYDVLASQPRPPQAVLDFLLAQKHAADALAASYSDVANALTAAL